MPGQLITTKLPRTLLDRLKKLRIAPREPYYNIIHRLIQEHEGKKNG